jgi:hypothetical protein
MSNEIQPWIVPTIQSETSINHFHLVRIRNVFPLRHELCVYVPEDDILHSHRRENLKSYIALTGWAL